MKATMTTRAVLALGLPSAIARGLGRLHRMHRDLLGRAGHEAGKGNVMTAAILVAIYLAA